MLNVQWYGWYCTRLETDGGGQALRRQQRWARAHADGAPGKICGKRFCSCVHSSTRPRSIEAGQREDQQGQRLVSAAVCRFPCTRLLIRTPFPTRTQPLAEVDCAELADPLGLVVDLAQHLDKRPHLAQDRVGRQCDLDEALIGCLDLHRAHVLLSVVGGGDGKMVEVGGRGRALS